MNDQEQHSSDLEITDVKKCHKHSIAKPKTAAQTKKEEEEKKKPDKLEIPLGKKNGRKRRKMYGELTISDVSSDEHSIDLNTLNPEEVKEMTRRELAEVQSKLYK